MLMFAFQQTSAVADHVPLLPYLLIVLGLVAALLTLPLLLGRKTKNAVKSASYECGVAPKGSARQRFSVHFYLVAVLFILFDIEAVFLFPWALNIQGLGLAGFVEAVVFVAVLGLGLGYAWRKGVLDWQ